MPIQNHSAIVIRLEEKSMHNNWRSNSETDSTWTVPNWPPSANTDEDNEPTISDESTAPAATTIQPIEILPHPPTTEISSEDIRWRIISIVFIALTLILLLISIILYIVMPKPKKTIRYKNDNQCQQIFSIPRPKPNL